MVEDVLAERGILFDIARSSLHDGPGVRTTVFFKGCTLRCLWCHNPESYSPFPQLSYAEEKCIDCGVCASACPTGAQGFSGETHSLDFERCVACGKCVAVCPTKALRIIGREWTVDEIMDEVMKDAAFYASSGGGVTLSGGEPLFQAEFAIALLEAAKSRNLHICLETCGEASRGSLESALRSVDLFLFDYKATDSSKHAAFTGSPNARILSNLEFLSGEGAAIILRCPLIPGVNDDEEHLAGIAELSRRLPAIECVELLPYHDLGKSKGKNIGIEMELADLSSVEEERASVWLAALRSLGCEKARLG